MLPPTFGLIFERRTRQKAREFVLRHLADGEVPMGGDSRNALALRLVGLEVALHGHQIVPGHALACALVA